MGGEPDGRANGGDSAQPAGNAKGADAAARQTPHESTLLLPTPTGPAPDSRVQSDASPSVENDVPRLRPGESLGGRFTILRFIAQGGMGAVYEANDVMLRSGVALKVIRGRIATDATAMERFRREVLLARRVSHPNVCRVYELYDATTSAREPIHFLTMELLEGETLSQRIACHGRLTTADALPLVRQLCEGLAAAHAEGVIHRDFKSSNVMLVPRRDGGRDSVRSTRVAITDFGIARAVQLGTGETAGEPLTGGGGILGTPEYMAPEQVTGGTVTQATDIYALGVVLYEMVTGKLPFTGDTPLVAAAKRLNEAPPRPEATTPGLDARWSATILRCLARAPERRFKSALDILPELERPRRPWPRWALAGAVALALALAAFAGARGFPSLRKGEPPRSVAPAAPRPVLAVLGFRDELASPALAWLPTAVSEALSRELSAAEMSLRVIPGDRVDQVRRSLGVSEEAVNEPKVRDRMQGLLVANVAVFGTLKPMAQDSGAVGLSVKMVDAASGRELASFEEDLGEGASTLGEKVSSAAERLRQTLGVSLTPGQASALSASQPRNLSAARSYAQGVLSLRRFEYENARSYFEAALAMDGSFLDAQRRVVEMWEHEGNVKKAREAAERIRSRPSGLTPRQLAETEAKILGLGPETEKGMEAQQALFDATPDDVELGLLLLTAVAPRTGAAIVDRLRELPPGGSGDLRLDADEAFNAWQLGDFKRAEGILLRLKARAQALGARREMGDALVTEAWMLWAGEGRASDSLGPFEEAARHYAEIGDLAALGLTKNWEANAMSVVLPTSTVLKALEENAALVRRLGNHRWLREVLHTEASLLFKSGDYKLATTKLQEALSESEAIDEGPGPYQQAGKAYLALAQADMEGVRNALHLLRTDPARHLDSTETEVLSIEVQAFLEQDRLQEARENLEKFLRRQVAGGQFAYMSLTQTALCEITCDEGHPQEGLDCLSKHTPPSGASTTELVASNLRLTKCRFLAGDLEGAEKSAVEAGTDAQRLGAYVERVLANTYFLRVHAAQGETAKAIGGLRAELASAESKKAWSLAFEVRLALGEVELRARRPMGRTRLLKLEQEAKSHEFLRIARLAREALDEKPAAPKTEPVR